MKFEKVISSNIEGATYDAKEQLMFVRFKGSAVYEYERVPFALWKKFQKTFDGKQSAGSFLSANVKGKFECRKLSEEEVESLQVEG